VLAIAGLYITVYWGAVLFAPEFLRDVGIVVGGEKVSGALRSWIGGQDGENAMFAFAILLAIILAWALRQHIYAKKNSEDPVTKFE